MIKPIAGCPVHGRLECGKNGVKFVEHNSTGPYQIWEGDAYVCQSCGFFVVVDFGERPLSKQGDSNFQRLLEQSKKGPHVEITAELERIKMSKLRVNPDMPRSLRIEMELDAERKLHIVSGHRRIAACFHLGLREVSIDLMDQSGNRRQATAILGVDSKGNPAIVDYHYDASL